MLALTLIACTRAPADATTPASTADTAPPEPPACPSFLPGEPVGVVAADRPDEISGLVWRDGVLWALDDGDKDLTALDPTGAVLATVALDRSTVLVDWEDLAPLGDRLLIGDIGDNLAARQNVRLLQVTPPEITTSRVDWPVDAETVLQWPDGPHDAETLLADPVSGDVLLVAKDHDGDTPVIRVGGPLPEVALGIEVARLTFGEGLLQGNTLTTGGTVAPDGTAVVIRTYLDAFLWPRVPGEPWERTFERDPCRIDLAAEPQGETVAWSPDGLYTISEGVRPTILLHRFADGARRDIP
ncbi:MAG: hypothetical protein H6734_27830 [Alphaproteobacteria bacterium]|nr:hypothetical protein [Alphaproteobacteria bacterium]